MVTETITIYYGDSVSATEDGDDGEEYGTAEINARED